MLRCWPPIDYYYPPPSPSPPPHRRRRRHLRPRFNNLIPHHHGRAVRDGHLLRLRTARAQAPNVTRRGCRRGQCTVAEAQTVTGALRAVAPACDRLPGRHVDAVHRAGVDGEDGLGLVVGGGVACLEDATEGKAVELADDAGGVGGGGGGGGKRDGSVTCAVEGGG